MPSQRLHRDRTNSTGHGRRVHRPNDAPGDRGGVYPGVRISEGNPNHHLWNNNGTWFLHYTVYPTPFTKERIRRSLGTKDVKVARERRDNFFSLLAKQSTAQVPVADQTTAFA